MNGSRKRVLILGAAGRDFHNFNTVFRDAPEYEVVGFTAAQIPNIANRTYPPELSGRLYPQGIPIHEQTGWERIVRDGAIDEVVFAYSDVSHQDVMHIASRAVAAGADFRMLGANATMLTSQKPVVSVCAVRTGCGKSPVSRYVARLLRDLGIRVAVVRHPMPYGDLAKQAVQRYAMLDDLSRNECTIEEREEYEPHIVAGDLVFAGVDYAAILHAAEAEADVILWDGGNNDMPFYKPDLEIVLVDPHRPGDETSYFPGEANLVRAGVVVIPKVDTASVENLTTVRANIKATNPNATVVELAMPPTLDDAEAIRGKRVLVVEDGPTLTHGGMGYGAGFIAAQRYGAAEIVDPRPFAVGSIRHVFEQFGKLGPVLPAMGYTDTQVAELDRTIESADCDIVVVATPVDLRRLLNLRKPAVRVTYEVQELGPPHLGTIVREFARERGLAAG